MLRFREKQNTENEKTRKETLKKGEQEIGGTRKKTQETKEKGRKDLRKKGGTIKEKKGVKIK